jgi:hypothetical protein
MGMIKALFKYDNHCRDWLNIDTTSGSGEFRDLSPFVLRVPNSITGEPVIFENFWQFSKVYSCHLWSGEPNEEWWNWRRYGWANQRAIRYPMGKGAKPEYSYWDGEKLGYIEARKKIYAPIYAKYVEPTQSFKTLREYSEQGNNIILRDYDAYDHEALGITLKDVINNPNRKMGHAFVLIMMLTGVLADCLN